MPYVASNNNLTRTKSQYHRTQPGRLVNFSSFRVSNRHQQQSRQQPQPQTQPQQTSHGGGGGASPVARAVAVGGNRLLSASGFGHAPQRQHDNGTATATVVARVDTRKNHRTATAVSSLRYCKSVSPIAEKPPPRRSPPRSASMNLQARTYAATADSFPR
ncbi:adenylyl cyclase 78C-like isoform X2 [Aphis craccivora]|uniref:Adenylyl cyclase 78C-like isoform X2 n=1 Tax=Aphis craccivora TaxID=307492 RepID=A0A6G0ZHM0_APHCR|nr:adenylyl cyclase 78C-like isoform X2 [Aphis craccivora]